MASFAKHARRCLIGFLAAALVSSGLTLHPLAEENTAGTTAVPAAGTEYDAYLAAHKDARRPAASAEADLRTAKGDESAQLQLLDSHEGKPNVLLWKGLSGKAEIAVSVPESGLYNIALTYMPLLPDNRGIELALIVDGASPYKNAESLTFSTIYRNGEKKTDNRGNDQLPRQLQQAEWVTQPCIDPDGLYDAPLLFYLEQGGHTLTLDVELGAFYLAEIRLYNEEEPLSYEQKLAQWKAEGAADAQNAEILLEGEDASAKSGPTLIPLTDRVDAATSPNSPSEKKLNMIASSTHGQWMTWEFDVPASGFYHLGMRFRQNALRGFFVTRRITINGKVPFAEMDGVKFPYGSGWQYRDVGDESGAYRVYLEKGPCTIKVEVVLGDFSDILRELSSVSEDMNLLYRKIIMITGVSPDPNRDYFLEEQIDGFSETLKSMAGRLRRYGDELEALSGVKGSEAAFLFEVAEQLDSLRERPETIRTRLDRFSSNMSGLSAWILLKKEQAMDIDYLRITSPEKGPLKAKAGFFEGLLFRVQSVIASYTTDYSAVGSTTSTKEALTVWVNTGVDQAAVLKAAVEEMFVSETGIPINLQLVPGSSSSTQGGSLLEATLAGQGPDVALMVDRTTVVNLAARGVLIPLSGQPGFQETIKPFLPETMVPYYHEGECYALPVTQNFNMMFYRTDIFDELGLKPPQTWEELAEIIAVLQANNMQVAMGTPPSATTMPVADIFATLMLQRGVTYYNEELSATNFDKPEAVEAFKQWTQFFTQSTLPDSFDFYNRFRTGEMPLGIQPLSQYNMLALAAPEIRNLWEMIPIPGVKRADGTIDRAEIGNGTGCIAMKRVTNPDDAWRFMQWWASADAQERFGRDMEMFVGIAARYDTANIDAFRRMPWTPRESSALYEQWQQVREIPEIPAGYYTTRGVANAFRNVLYNYENPREALFYQNRLINKEITRKRSELGIQ